MNNIINNLNNIIYSMILVLFTSTGISQASRLIKTYETPEYSMLYFNGSEIVETPEQGMLQWKMYNSNGYLEYNLVIEDLSYDQPREITEYTTNAIFNIKSMVTHFELRRVWIPNNPNGLIIAHSGTIDGRSRVTLQYITIKNDKAYVLTQSLVGHTMEKDMDTLFQIMNLIFELK